MSLVSIMAVVLAAPLQASPGVAPVTFEKNIKPIFQAQCAACHSKSQIGNAAISGGYALDTYQALMRGVVGAGKPDEKVVVAGKSAESELYKRLVTSEASKRMPKGGEPLSDKQIALVARWIDSGMPRGAVAPARPVPPPKPEIVPLLSVNVPTGLAAPAALAGTAKDAKLGWAAKVGPLPPVTAIAFSPDGKWLAVGGYRTVFLWDLANLRVDKSVGGFAGGVQSLDWSKDNSTLLVAGGEPSVRGEIVLLDAKTGYSRVRTFDGHTDVVYSAVLSPNGATVATASHDKTVRTWETATAKALQVIKIHSDVVYQVRFTPDGKDIVTASQDRSVREYTAETGKVVRAFEGHTAAVTALAVRPDGKFFVSSGVEPRLRWWNPADGSTPRYSDGHSIQVLDAAFSADGKMLAGAGADMKVRLFDGDSGGHLRECAGSTDWVFRVAFSPSGKLVAGGCADGFVRIWNTADGKLLCQLLASGPREGAWTGPEWAAFSPLGYLAVSEGWGRGTALTVAGKVAPSAAAKPLAAILMKGDLIANALRGEAVEAPLLEKKP